MRSVKVNRMDKIDRELFSSTLRISESDVNREEDLSTLMKWKITTKKDIVNMRENLDQLTNPFLLKDGYTEEETSIAAHKARYAKERRELFLEIITDRIDVVKAGVHVL